ncbi:MAG: O-methyltransferase [Acidobacteria bacterium]|nr:O-methyltransferase [Acidobacteriota bacterium]
MSIVHPRIEAYLRALAEDDEPVLWEMERWASELQFPVVGPLVGRMLYQMASLIGARRVFELGSGFGYSALFLAKAVGPNGRVVCTDHSERNRQQAEAFLRRAGVWDRIQFHVGHALTVLQQVGGTWDLIFNDIDKEDYPATIDLAYRHLRPGGLFISDNVLWGGRVLDDSGDDTPVTRAIRAFNRQLFAHPGFYTVVYPLRDGVAVAVRQPG